MQIVNIAAYRFLTLSNLPELKQTLLDVCRSLELKGTVLLAEEGINLFLAGSRQSMDAFVDWLRHGPAFDGRLAELEIKESFSSSVPFRKMLVKIKREIIRMNHPAIRPEAGRAPAVDSRTALRWITQGTDDSGRPVVLLDTRNDFEVDEGTFDGAIDWRLSKFTEFPEQLLAHRHELEDKTVISFCTGGIRCEKAAIYMQDVGLEHVYQLDGGILKYFEETGGQGYQGRCFVFDEREALDPGLRPKR